MTVMNYSCFANLHGQCPGFVTQEMAPCECVCHRMMEEPDPERVGQDAYIADVEAFAEQDWAVIDDDGEVDEDWVHPLLHAQTQAAMIQVEDIDDTDVLLTAVTNASDMLARCSLTLQDLGIPDDLILLAMKEWPHLKIQDEDFED